MLSLPGVSLDDKYTAISGRIYLNGIQALVRLAVTATPACQPRSSRPSSTERRAGSTSPR